MMAAKLLLIGLIIVMAAEAGSTDYAYQDRWEGACSTGLQQSPIDIITQNTTACSMNKFKIDFWDGPTVVIPSLKGPSSLESKFPSSVLTIVNEDGFILQYSSAQYHLHVGAEHQIDGYKAAVELHIVHKLNPFFQDEMSYSVVGLLFDIDDSNTTNLFDQISFIRPGQANFKNVIEPLLTDANIYHYKGSLTTPSCTEVVNWYVVQKIFPIRSWQLAVLQKAINNGKSNQRNPQPLNGRPVFLITPNCSDNFPIIRARAISQSENGDNLGPTNQPQDQADRLVLGNKFGIAGGAKKPIAPLNDPLNTLCELTQGSQLYGALPCRRPSSSIRKPRQTGLGLAP